MTAVIVHVALRAVSLGRVAAVGAVANCAAVRVTMSTRCDS